MPEHNSRPPARGTVTGLAPSALLDVLLRAIDNTPDAWAVFGIDRDEGGAVLDLRLLHGNAGYWELSGLTPAVIGRSVAEIAPTIDWTTGIAAMLIQAARSGSSCVDRNVRTRPQTGPLAGQERVFEVELTATHEALAAGFRDITADLEAVDRQTEEARRSLAIARFLSTAIDPTVGRHVLLAALADELASTIGDLVLVTESTEDGGIRVLAATGGPGGLAAEIRASHLGTPIPAASWSAAAPDRGPIIERPTVHFATIPDELRETLAASFEKLRLPAELARTLSSHISAPIQNAVGRPGRVVLERFGDDAPYTTADVTTVETIASAAALVLERRTAADQLAASLTRFEALFEQAPTPMVVLGSDRPAHFNAAALALFDRTRDEMAAHAFAPDAPWIPDDHAGGWAELRRRAASGEWTGVSRLFLRRPSGELRDVEFSGIPLVVDGRIDGVIAVMNDLTDREALEAQLRHAQKMEALGRLAGGIAHDFNNILMGILGFGEFITADARDGRASVEDAEQIVAATRRAVDLTARLTTFARRDATVLERGELASIIDGTLPLIRRLIPESIEVVTELEPGPDVIVDRVEFEQILVNLVVNAVDAMPAGGRLTIEAHADVADPGGPGDPSGQHGTHRRAVMVAVTDTGIGMDEDTRLRVFEPFFTTKAVGVGTGLGLSMVYAAVERAGGRIWVYSEPGRGTTFRMYLPHAPSAGIEAPAPAPPAVIRGGTESILLLEDDDLVRDVVARTLRGLGYDVAEASRPSEALVLAEKRPFDLLVSDVVMPEMSGDAVANEVRARLPELPVVFMSGYTARALDFQLGRRDALIHKPVAPSELGAAIRVALDG